MSKLTSLLTSQQAYECATMDQHNMYQILPERKIEQPCDKQDRGPDLWEQDPSWQVALSVAQESASEAKHAVSEIALIVTTSMLGSEIAWNSANPKDRKSNYEIEFHPLDTRKRCSLRIRCKMQRINIVIVAKQNHKLMYIQS